MGNLSLTACAFSIRKKHPSKKRTTEIYALNEVLQGGENQYDNIFELIKDFCNKYSNNYSNDVHGKKVLKILNNEVQIEENDRLRYIYVEIESGSYGYYSNIINTETNVVSYNRKREDAEVFKFRILFAIPKDENTYKGIILFQNDGQYGVKSLITDYFHKFVSETIDAYTEIGNVCPEQVVEKLLAENTIKKIIYTRNNISNDESDIDTIGYGKEERVITKLFNTDSLKKLISTYLHGNNRVFEFENKNYDDFKVVCDINGKERKFSVNNIDNMSIIEGIPSDVLNQNNDIDDNKLKEHFANVAKGYLQHMVYRLQ